MKVGADSSTAFCWVRSSTTCWALWACWCLSLAQSVSPDSVMHVTLQAAVHPIWQYSAPYDIRTVCSRHPLSYSTKYDATNMNNQFLLNVCLDLLVSILHGIQIGSVTVKSDIQQMSPGECWREVPMLMPNLDLRHPTYKNTFQNINSSIEKCTRYTNFLAPASVLRQGICKRFSHLFVLSLCIWVIDQCWIWGLEAKLS
jgi:hypothetical protein